MKKICLTLIFLSGLSVYAFTYKYTWTCDNLSLHVVPWVSGLHNGQHDAVKDIKTHLDYFKCSKQNIVLRKIKKEH